MWVVAALGAWLIGDLAIHLIAKVTFASEGGPSTAVEALALVTLAAMGVLYILLLERLLGPNAAFGTAAAILGITGFQYAAAIAWSMGSIGIGTLDGWTAAEYASQMVAMVLALTYVLVSAMVRRTTMG